MNGDQWRSGSDEAIDPLDIGDDAPTGGGVVAEHVHLPGDDGQPTTWGRGRSSVLASLHHQLRQADERATAAEARLGSLEREHEQATRLIEELLAERSSPRPPADEQRLVSLTDQARRIARERDELRGLLARARGETLQAREQATAALALARRQRDRLARVETETAAASTPLHERLRSAEEERDRLASRERQLAEDIERALVEAEQAREQLVRERAEAARHDVPSEATGSGREELERALAETRQQYDQLAQALQQQRTLTSGLERRLEERRGAAASLRHEHARLLDDHQRVLDELQAARTRAGDVEQRLHDAGDERDLLAWAHSDLERRLHDDARALADAGRVIHLEERLLVEREEAAAELVRVRLEAEQGEERLRAHVTDIVAERDRRERETAAHHQTQLDGLYATVQSLTSEEGGIGPVPASASGGSGAEREDAADGETGPRTPDARSGAHGIGTWAPTMTGDPLIASAWSAAAVEYVEPRAADPVIDEPRPRRRRGLRVSSALLVGLLVGLVVCHVAVVDLRQLAGDAGVSVPWVTDTEADERPAYVPLPAPTRPNDVPGSSLTEARLCSGDDCNRRYERPDGLRWTARVQGRGGDAVVLVVRRGDERVHRQKLTIPADGTFTARAEWDPAGGIPAGDDYEYLWLYHGKGLYQDFFSVSG